MFGEKHNTLLPEFSSFGIQAFYPDDGLHRFQILAAWSDGEDSSCSINLSLVLNTEQADPYLGGIAEPAYNWKGDRDNAIKC